MISKTGQECLGRDLPHELVFVTSLTNGQTAVAKELEFVRLNYH